MSTATAFTTADSTTEATPSRAWALAGVGAAIASMAGMAGTMMVPAVYDSDIEGDASAIQRYLGEHSSALAFFHTSTVIGALLLVVFAAGLARRLRERVPSSSLVPPVVAAGLNLVAVVQLMGAALDTEFMNGDQDPIVPEVSAMYGHWINTVPWFWAGAGLAGLGLALASLRYAAAPRWIGLVSLALGGLTTLVAVSPLEYVAGMTGPVWLLLVAASFLVGDGHPRLFPRGEH